MERVFEINTIEELSEFQVAWRNLHEVTPHASFFQSLDWLTAFWRHTAKDRKLRVLMVGTPSDLIGILPLNVQPMPTRLGQLRLLTYPTDAWGSFFGPIGADPTRILHAALDYLPRAEPDFDVAELKYMPLEKSLSPHNGDGKQSHDSIAIDGLHFDECTRVAMIDLVGTWPEYWHSLRRDHNRWRNVERCERRLTEKGQVTYIRYRPGGTLAGEVDPRWDWYDACENLAARSWQSGLTDGNTLSHPHVREFLRDAHVAATNAGALDVNLLFLNEQLVAFVYAYHYRGYLDLMRAGFDPDLAKLAPGNALWTRLIRDSFARGDRVLDLGPTCLDYKKFWLTRLEPTYQLAHFPWRPKSQLLRCLRSLKRCFPQATADTNQRSKKLAKSTTPAATQESQAL